jgi:hypothetical protein
MSDSKRAERIWDHQMVVTMKRRSADAFWGKVRYQLRAVLRSWPRTPLRARMLRELVREDPRLVRLRLTELAIPESEPAAYVQAVLKKYLEIST